MEKKRSIYLRGAEDGLLAGPLLAAFIVCFGATVFVPMLFLPSMALLVATPVVTYLMLRRAYIDENYQSSFSTIWLHGICIFFFGGLIMSFVAFACMRWIWPDYISDMLQMAVEVGKTSTGAEMAAMTDAIEQSIEDHKVPTAASVVIDLLYMVVLLGTMVSMVLAMIVRAGNKPQDPTQTPPPINS